MFSNAHYMVSAFGRPCPPIGFAVSDDVTYAINWRTGESHTCLRDSGSSMVKAKAF